MAQITTDDLKDDFGLLGMGSPGNAAAAKKQLLRMQEVIEGVGVLLPIMWLPAMMACESCRYPGGRLAVLLC